MKAKPNWRWSRTAAEPSRTMRPRTSAAPFTLRPMLPAAVTQLIVRQHSEPMKALTTISQLVAIGLLGACFGCRSVLETQPKDEAGLDDPLVMALLQKNYSTATQLLKGGYPVGGRSVFKQSPAYWAIAEGDLEALRLLIRFGLDVNYEWRKEGGNLLTNAVQFGHLEQVRLLVDSGASLVRDSRYGRSPLYSAVIYDQKAIETYLRLRGAQFNDWDLDAFEVLGRKTQ